MGRGAKISIAWMVLSAGSALAQGTMAQEATRHAPSKPSTSLTVTVAGTRVTMTPTELGGMAQQTVKVVNGHSGKEESYTGVRLSDVLAKAGAKLGKETLHGYVVAKGTDGYWVLYSGEEIVGTVHAGEVIVATSVNGRPLEADGAMKLVSTEDKKPERWVRNLTAVEWKAGVE